MPSAEAVFAKVGAAPRSEIRTALAVDGSTAMLTAAPPAGNEARPPMLMEAPAGQGGCPCASERIRWRIAAPRVGKRASTSWPAASSSSGFSSISGSPARSKKLSSPDRNAPRTPTRAPTRRRATNPNTSALARSSHGRSSITTRTGRATAAWRNSVRVALDTTRPVRRHALAET